MRTFTCGSGRLKALHSQLFDTSVIDESWLPVLEPALERYLERVGEYLAAQGHEVVFRTHWLEGRL